ncbi:helix-turn-helix domain-containing protein [uncultured Maricaulis sp.]|uniref:MerR family transcriptional regulator n=1 Tax=uncultured Maricaulis sp. TaxID=174710 RepID=UPI0030D860AA|tara:strand:- start:5777 stop:6208 length:432 start_codon:yes stop_codon:yes gene_type:complete
MSDLSIGKLSRASGVKVPTIRYYETIGLLAAPPRSEGGQRRYDKADVERLRFIRHGRALGFGLDDLRALQDLSDRPNQSCERADAIASRQLAEVERRIAGLEAVRVELARMLDHCAHGEVDQCRVIETLSDHALCESDHPKIS